jgi:hypothetical protein
MKTKDIYFALGTLAFFLPFFISDAVYQWYKDINQEHGMVMSFVKFGILATYGEVLALRIKAGVYHQPRFGILPRMLVWGLLGLTIKMAFVIFASGTPAFLAYLGISPEMSEIGKKVSFAGVLTAFSISVAMNLIYAPVMMTLHKITDEHIRLTSGHFGRFFRPIPVAKIFGQVNWDVMWHFVFKKTIPLFWIPAHTITFLLPAEMRVLFAALLSIALGVILAVAGMAPKKP